MSGIEARPIGVALDDGAKVTVTRFAGESPRAIMIVMPALGVPAAYYEPLARALAARGIDTVTADLRGLGGSSVRVRRGVEFGYARLVADARCVVSTLRSNERLSICLLGHSLGGHVAAMLAGREPGAVDALAFVACGTPYWKKFAGRTGLFVYGLSLAANVFSATLGYFPGQRIGFGGTESAKLMREWARLARSGRFAVDGFDAEQALANVRNKALFVSLAHDYLAPPAAVDHLVGKLKSATITRVHLDESHADRRALDHFRWAKEGAAVATAVTEWLRG